MMFLTAPVPEPESSEAPVVDLESRKVQRWRTDYLLKAGYDAEAAYLIGQRQDVDLHKAGDLLKNGCSISTALLILL